MAKVEGCFYMYMTCKYSMITLLVMVKMVVQTILAQIFGICVKNFVLSLACFLVSSCNWVKLWMVSRKSANFMDIPDVD
jgi:hypothetical protein